MLSNSIAGLGSKGVSRETGHALSWGLEFIGRHPLPILALPSIWYFIFYLPFWKSSDVLCQLGDPFSSENILLVPPLYCLVGRIPFWLTDTLLLGSAPNLFTFQHPSLTAVYVLIV